jgi:hypothetical protein
MSHRENEEPEKKLKRRSSYGKIHGCQTIHITSKCLRKKKKV